MAEVLSHRGPDEEGFYQSGPVAFAHRRLSIIDLAGGQQPMETPDGQVCVSFNGEIYNYPELKAELEQRGHVFRTRSDTEVLLALYVRDGLEAFAQLNGMFACAFWDRAASRLVLVRDRLGKKPLFYYRDAQRVLFASEIKALLAFGGVERTVNRTGKWAERTGMDLSEFKNLMAFKDRVAARPNVQAALKMEGQLKAA